jgi:phosphoglucomutase
MCITQPGYRLHHLDGIKKKDNGGNKMNWQDAYKEWTTNEYFDESVRKELTAIQDEKELEDRFYRELEFGTGGLRGVIGYGTNRMNIYTVRKATQGLANYIINENGRDKGVAIAFDSRRMSPEFAREAALCLNANGIKTYIFDSLRPTPELSFAVRELHCIAGIVITASHNPSEYNGYKVYWEDGAQITPPHDKNILDEVAKVTDYGEVKTMDIGDAWAQDLYHIIDDEMDDKYMEQLKAQSIHPELIKKMAEDIKIVYTPLHGTGNLPVRRVLKELGFKQVYVVEEQKLPDGNFPTVSYPNPEDPKAFTLALSLAKKVDADIILATDPDADRLGVYAKNTATGEYVSFTGNMSGMLIADYILKERKELGSLPSNAALVKTIVTTNMADVLCEKYNVKMIEVLTGFKYIGEQIKLFKENNSYEYMFGLEESYGCLAGTYARDKDACVAVMMLCEVAAYYKSVGKTLWDGMIELYENYGYFKEDLETITMKGITGAKQIEGIMEKLRNDPPKVLGGIPIKELRDYRRSIATTVKDCDGKKAGETQKLTLPKSNVLYFDMDDNAWCCARPSGTEPKIKFYIGVKGDSLADSEKKLSEVKNSLINMIETN